MDFFDWKKFTQGQWLALSVVVVFLLLFLWGEHERMRPSREASESFDKSMRDYKKLDCKFLREAQNWAEYDSKKCSSL